MKKLLLPTAIAFLSSQAFAGDDVVAFSSSSTGVGVLRGGGNLYRPAPRGSSIANLSPDERYRAVIYRPTQHFYTKDNVVSYRYSGAELSEVGNEYGGSYLGPHGAQFVPTQHVLAPHGTARSYASVNKRPQPGVPMIARTTKITRTAEAKSGNREAAFSSIQLAKAN